MCFARFRTIIDMLVISTGIYIFQNEQNPDVNTLQCQISYCMRTIACGYYFGCAETKQCLSNLPLWHILLWGKAQLQVLQDAWTECEGNWRTSSFYKKITGRSTVSEQGCRRWMTRAQLAKKYDSLDYADHIIAAKNQDEELRATHTKDHPDAPGVKAGSMGCGIWDAAGLKFVLETSDDLLFAFFFKPLSLILFCNHLS